MIDLSTLPVGAVLATYGDDLYRDGLPNNWYERLGLRIVYSQIHVHQRHVWPDAPRTQCDAIHSQGKIYTLDGTSGLWGSVTTPRCVIEEPRLDADWRARAFIWEGTQFYTPECWAAYEQVWNDLLGTEYDYKQLVQIKFWDWFGWAVKDPRIIEWILDPSHKRRVCSVGCMAAHYAAWQKFRAPRKSEADHFGRFFPPPNLRANGKKLYLEHVPPAFFENEPRWFKVGEQGFSH